MSLDLLDLYNLQTLDTINKDEIPVSIVTDADGTSHVVSRFGDPIWDFYPYMPQKNQSSSGKKLYWGFRLPDGRLLTDPEHAPLLASAKDLIWSLFTQPIEGRKRPTMKTIINKSFDLIPLLRWMVNLGLTRFADLAARTLDYVPVACTNPDGSRAAKGTVVCRLLMVEALYLQRDKIRDALAEHPWPHETTYSLVGYKQSGSFRKPKTAFIPDTTAARIGEAALEYVQARSPRILAALLAVEELTAEKASAGHSIGAQQNARTAAARSAGFQGTTELRAESLLLRTACYIVIDMFSGVRDSEMMSLVEGCVASGLSRDGSIDIHWLHGTIYKTGVRPHKWLVPAVVQQAVAVLTHLTAPLRERLRKEEADLNERVKCAISRGKMRLVKRLHTVTQQKDNLFLTTKGSSSEISVISNYVMRQNLKAFCAHHGIVGEDATPYPLHSHQFRRTYARFIARSELGDLLTLRDHFGHYSIDMTTYYADGGSDEYQSDTELLELIAEEKMERQKEIMCSYLDSDAPLGNGGHWLKSWRSSVRTAPNKESLISEYAGSLILTGTGHSWCVGTERGTCCGGLCVFEPQMCVECNHGLIGPEHRQVWEGIRDQQLEALALDDMGPGGRARAQMIISEAEKVLCRLDGMETT